MLELVDSKVNNKEQTKQIERTYNMSETHTHVAVNPAHTPQPIPTPPKKEKPDLTKVKPYEVERNGVKKSLTAFAGSRGNWDGVVYQAPQVEIDGGKPITEDSTFLTNLAWFGKENVKRILNVFARRMAQDYHRDAIPDKDDEAGFPEGAKAGHFFESLFLKSMTEFAAPSLKISELTELYNDAVDAMKDSSSSFIQKLTAVMTTSEFLAANTEERKVITDKAAAEYNQLIANVNSLKLELEARKARRSREEQTETVAPE